MRSLRIAALVVAVALGGAACGGGDDDDGEAAASSTTVVDEATAAQDLAARLLTAADLATDDPLDAPWVDGDVQQGVEIELPPCLDEDESDPTAVASTAAKFVTDNQYRLPSLEEELTTYAGDGAAAAFAAAAARLDGCVPAFVFQGTPSTGTIARLPLALGGDQAMAWRTAVTIAGAEVAVTTIQVLEGDVVMSLVHTDITAPDQAAIERYAAAATDKL